MYETNGSRILSSRLEQREYLQFQLTLRWLLYRPRKHQLTTELQRKSNKKKGGRENERMNAKSTELSIGSHEVNKYGMIDLIIFCRGIDAFDSTMRIGVNSMQLCYFCALLRSAYKTENARAVVFDEKQSEIRQNTFHICLNLTNRISPRI